MFLLSTNQELRYIQNLEPKRRITDKLISLQQQIKLNRVLHNNVFYLFFFVYGSHITALFSITIYIKYCN